MSAALQYLPHIIYATALTSIATHHLQQRKAFEAERAHVAAQLSILEDLRTRLSAAEELDRREIERLWRLAKSHDVWRAREEAARGESSTAQHVAGVGAAEGEDTIGWKEVLFGKRFDTRRSEELDRKDLERVRKEVEEAG
ncbi:hypothetical protein FKP32DRAFT_1665730 [Trametes sanguinea]|nr:hypothetical protein FKP32DRAFT_1665730 [Trametes sanguinea]